VLRVRSAVAGALVVLGLAAPVAGAHEGNPNFRSEVRSIAPPVEGLSARILNFDDNIELRNDTGETLVVEGYRDEPYVRIRADGTVEVNRRSPTFYLNEDRFAEGVTVPDAADPKAPPAWRVVDRTGRYSFHDHRVHWMSRQLPPQVKDEHERTKVFDWQVPVEVGGRRVAIAGTLTWVGTQSGGFPIAAAISLAVVVVAAIALVVVVRRRRRTGAPGEERPATEAW
jgi:hypothetical protein